MKENPFRRLRMRLWVYPTLQGRFIRQVVVITFAFSALMALAMYFGTGAVLHKEFSPVEVEKQLNTFVAIKGVDNAVRLGRVDDYLLSHPEILKEYQAELKNNVLAGAGQWLFVSLLLLMPFLVLVSMVLSHRLVGGLFRMENYLAQLKKGKMNSPFYVRENDDLKKISDDLQEVLKGIRAKITQIQESTTKLERLSNTLEAELARKESDPKQLKRIRDEQAKIFQELVALTRHFSV